MKTKKIKSYLGNGSWSESINIGADAENVDYIKNNSHVTVQDELDDINTSLQNKITITVNDENESISFL